MRRIILTLSVAVLTVAAVVHASPESVKEQAQAAAELSTPEQKAERQRTLDEKATWEAQQERARNADDDLLDDFQKANEQAASIVNDPSLSAESVEQAIDRYSEQAHELVDGKTPSLEQSIEAISGTHPSVQSMLDAIADNPEPPVTLAKYRLLVSRSMGEGALKRVMEIAEAHPDMVIVFRGLLPGERVTDLIGLLGKLRPPTEGEPVANVALDPTAFSDSGVTVVPRLERLDEEGNVLAWARGVANPEWIEDRFERGERGDLGQFGDTSEIAEEDMIEVMKRQLAEAHPEERARRNMEDFWKHQQWQSLPTATKDRRREVDPTVVLVDGITAPDGTVIAFPGQRVNPMDVMPFSMTLIVIDARDPAQIAFARKKVVELEGQDVTVVTTEIDPELGWKAYSDLLEGVGRMVYLLQPEMVDRFQLEKVPCTVEGGDRVLVVKEYALPQGNG